MSNKTNAQEALRAQNMAARWWDNNAGEVETWEQLSLTERATITDNLNFIPLIQDCDAADREQGIYRAKLGDLQEQVNQMYASAKFTEQVGTHPLVAIRLRQFADRIGEILAEAKPQP